jgi:hypothetical protein
MFSEFLFKLLDGVGPVDRLGRLVVIGDVLHERSFKGIRGRKMIGLEMFALQQTKPDFDLVQKGRRWEATSAPESAVARHTRLLACGASPRVV